MLSFSSNKTIKNLNEINRINCNIIIVRLILSQVKHFKHVVLKKCLHLNFKKRPVILSLQISRTFCFCGVTFLDSLVIGVCSVFQFLWFFPQYIWFNLVKMKKKFVYLIGLFSVSTLQNHDWVLLSYMLTFGWGLGGGVAYNYFVHSYATL